MERISGVLRDVESTTLSLRHSKPNTMPSMTTPTDPNQAAFEIQTALMTRGLEGAPPNLASSDPQCAVWLQLILDNAAEAILALKNREARYEARLAFMQEEVERLATDLNALERENADLKAANEE